MHKIETLIKRERRTHEIIKETVITYAYNGLCSRYAGSMRLSVRWRTLKMVTEATFPPYEYCEGDSIVGIDIDIANAIATSLG